MKDKDYIRATNLAKLEIAYKVLADVTIFEGTPISQAELQKSLIDIDEMIRRVRKALKIT